MVSVVEKYTISRLLCLYHDYSSYARVIFIKGNNFMLKWIWSYIRKYRIPMTIGLIFSVIVASFVVVNPLITGAIVDNVINAPQRDFSLLLKYL